MEHPGQQWHCLIITLSCFYDIVGQDEIIHNSSSYSPISFIVKHNHACDIWHLVTFSFRSTEPLQAISGSASIPQLYSMWSYPRSSSSPSTWGYINWQLYVAAYAMVLFSSQTSYSVLLLQGLDSRILESSLL